MKNMILVLLMFLFSIPLFSQDGPAKTFSNSNTYAGYMLMQHYLNSVKNHPGIFTTTIKPQWNSKLFNDHYNQLLQIDKEKKFYPPLVFNSSFVARGIPAKYAKPGYMWVSTQRRSFGEEVASDIISSLLSSKKHRFNANKNQKGYYTAIGMKY